jgi:hypothetical protein
MIPASIIEKFNQKEESVNFGSVTLEVVKHDGQITRYIWVDKSSEVEDSPTSGEGGHVIPKNNNHTDNGLNKELRK